MGAAGCVLLKNVNNTLPFKAPALVNIGVFGDDASNVTLGLVNPDGGFSIGTLGIGGGLGGGRNSFIMSPLKAIKKRASKTEGITVQYITNNMAISSGVPGAIYPWPDICFVFLKTWEVKGADRVSLKADRNSTMVVENVTSMCPGRMVIIMHLGGANTMPWALNLGVVGIITAHYPGQESGNSIVDVLFGDVKPSSQLLYTISDHTADYDGQQAQTLNVTGPDAAESWAWQRNFIKSLLIDYRHFDSQGINPCTGAATASATPSSSWC